jgi:excisionase family DNA binding protein
VSELNLTVKLTSDQVAEIARHVEQLLASRAPAEPDPWLNVAQAAAYLVCKPQRVYNLVSQRRLRHVKDGSRVLFRRQWLDEVLEGSS